MTELSDTLRLQGLALRSRLSGADPKTADLLCDAADDIELRADAEWRWIGRIYDIRAALGVGGLKADLDDLCGECKRALAAAFERGKAEGARL
jgi:hypothetical protein